MKISELQELLEKKKVEMGDVEVTVQATLLNDGYSTTGSKSLADVFESTVEGAWERSDGSLGKRLRLMWQC